MAIFDDPFDSRHALRASGCGCGQHHSQAEHDQAHLQQATIESEDKRIEGVVTSAVMRAMFPQDAARRAFLQSLGAPSCNRSALPRRSRRCRNSSR